MEQPFGKVGEKGAIEHLGKNSIMRRDQQLKTNAHRLQSPIEQIQEQLN